MPSIAYGASERVWPRAYLRLVGYRPGVFDAHEWSGDVKVGGTWRASGVGRGGIPWELEGTFLEVDPPLGPQRLHGSVHGMGVVPHAACRKPRRPEPLKKRSQPTKV